MRAVRWVIPSAALVLLLSSTTAGWLGRDQLATRVELEVLVAIVALTTFLIGFSTVRLQTRLEEHRADLARHTDRVIEENHRADMLPLPPEMQDSGNHETFNARDRLTMATEIFSMFNLALSGLLGFYHWQFYEGLAETERDPRYSYIGYVLILVFHLLVVALGIFASHETNRQARQERAVSVFSRYEALEKSLETWLRRQNNSDDLRRCCDELDEVLPSWTWLTLVRASLGDERCEISSLKRVHNLAAKDKHHDDYSLIAYVWSAYLKDSMDTSKNALSASVLVRLDELKTIEEFAESSANTKSRSGWTYAGLALRDVQRQVEMRGSPSDDLRELFERVQQRFANPKLA